MRTPRGSSTTSTSSGTSWAAANDSTAERHLHAALVDQPLPTNPNNTLVIQVLVTRNFNRGAADNGAVSRLPEEARLVTVKTRKAQ